MTGAPKDPADPILARAEELVQGACIALDDAVGALSGGEHSAAVELRDEARALLRRLHNLRLFRDRP